MILNFADGPLATVRLLVYEDADKLFEYFQHLSPETRSRFGPHSFDRQTVQSICQQPDTNMKRFIAIDNSSQSIVAYMIIQQGMIEGDQQRYAQRNQFYDWHTTVTYAPSIADSWQGPGLGSAMHAFIESELRSLGIRHIILWGGVQSSNLGAIKFYRKNGYQFVASFWHNDMDNHDMVKEL